MKKFLVLLLVLITLTGCKNTKKGKFYLDDKYYNNGSYIEITDEDLEKLHKDKTSYLLFTYNSYCTFKVPCDNVFEEVMKKYNIDMYSMPYGYMKKTYIYDTLKYAPSVIIVNKGEIIAYLDPEKDSDLNKYQDTKEFEEWLNQYIYLSKEK